MIDAVLGVGADDGDSLDRLRFERQDRRARSRRAVDEQDHRLLADATDQRPILRTIVGELVERHRSLRLTGPPQGPQQPAGLVVDDLVAHVTALDRRQQLGTHELRRSRHLEIAPTVGAGHPVVHGPPVGDHQPGERPLALEHLVEQAIVRTGEVAGDAVVRAHQRPRVDGGDGVLEGDQVQLAQGTLGDLRADRHALELGFVADVVLDARADAVVLEAGDEPRREARGEQRVLGVALEVAAAERRAVQVDRGPEKDLRALRLRLGGQRGADLLQQRRVPRRTERAADGEAGRRRPGQRVASRAVRTVGDLQRGDADPFDRDGGPRVSTRAE
jgi:hypothetical protein